MFRFIAGHLSAGKRLVTATVISRSGSGPREPGAVMVLPGDGPVLGTVGGGLLEGKTIEVARAALVDGRPRLLSFDLSNREASESGMICGGRVEILVDRLDGGNPDHRRIFQLLQEALDSGNRVRLIGSILVEPGGDVATGWGLIAGDNFAPGTLDRNFREAKRIGSGLQSDEPVLITDGDVRCFIQPIDLAERVWIVGAGHVGQALAGVCSIAGFRTIVIDDRSDFANRDRFPDSDEIRVIASYSEIWTESLHDRRAGASDSVVVVTRGHLYDRDVLAGALRTKAGYIGMIASRRKRDIIFRSLHDEGFAEEDIARVHSPIGLDIGARTPAEIAVSIAAELIAVRSKREQRSHDEPC